MERNEEDNAPAAPKQDSSGCSRKCGKGSNKIVVAIWVTLLLSGVGYYLYSRQKAAAEANRLLQQSYELYGRGDFVASTECLRQAAELGNALAQVYYGGHLRSGIGTETDMAAAVEWFRKAAKHRNASAYLWLGTCYENGEGVERDLVEAEKWYRKAVDADAGPGAQPSLDRVRQLIAAPPPGSE